VLLLRPNPPPECLRFEGDIVDPDFLPDAVDLDRPNVARIYDWALGGTANWAIDRQYGEQAVQAFPLARTLARGNRDFLGRAVRYCLSQGIRQFLDLGSGIPTVGNVHEVAQAADPAARVVYVDYEPVAVAHSQLLLTGNPRAAAVQADITRPADVLNSEPVRTMLDMTQPVGLLAVALGHYLRPEADVPAVFATYRDALAPGSHLALTHLTNDFAVLADPRVAETMRSTQDHIFPRPRAAVLALFEGFDLVEPGLTTTANWRPDRVAAAVDPQDDGLYAGVGVRR
jgi:hypothetical protein